MSYNISNDLAALPIETMIAKPLEAAVKAQAIAATTTARFIEDVGIDDDGNVRVVELNFTRKVVDDTGELVDEEVNLKVPFLTLVPVPFIRINKMTINFNFKIRSVSVDTQKQSLEIRASAKGKWPAFSFSINGSFSSSRTRKSSVDKSAELDIFVEAVQDEMPEGLRTLLTMLTDAMLPPSQAQQGQGGSG